MIVQFIDMGKIIKTTQEDPAVSLMLQQLCYRIFTGCLGKQSGDGIYFSLILQIGYDSGEKNRLSTVIAF